MQNQDDTDAVQEIERVRRHVNAVRERIRAMNQALGETESQAANDAF